MYYIKGLPCQWTGECLPATAIQAVRLPDAAIHLDQQLLQKNVFLLYMTPMYVIFMLNFNKLQIWGQPVEERFKGW